MSWAIFWDLFCSLLIGRGWTSAPLCTASGVRIWSRGARLDQAGKANEKGAALARGGTSYRRPKSC